MATNELLAFANGETPNVISLAEWKDDDHKSVVQKGFQSGVARSAEVNRVLAQGANSGFAIGELIKDYAGQDATLDAAGLYEGLKKALEAFSKRAVIDFIYPVGAIYVSTVETNPNALFGVGSWQRIGEGRCLVDAGASFAAGSTGGSATHTLTVNEMPAHSHAGSTSTAGAHTHTRGSMNITGGFGAARRGEAEQWRFDGAFYEGWRWNARIKSGGNDDWGSYYAFNAARTWTGETSSNGAHAHAVSVGATGGGQAFSIRNPYLAVYMWKRVA